MQMFWFGNEKKASPPSPLQGEGSRMLGKWRVKGVQLGGKLWGCVKPFHGFDAMICAISLHKMAQITA